jgi:hypothetical protein
VRKKESKSGVWETKHSLIQSQSLETQYPIMLKEMTLQEAKEYHLKKLYELSLKSLGEIPQLEEPTDEQKEWVLRKLKAPRYTGEANNQ